MNLSVATIRSYIFKRRKMKKKKCDKCGRREKLERWRGKNLCPSCLNPDTDIDISYAAHWAEYQRSLEMAYY
jgi:Zn finger protein HypA/HybF involved in hydrogenase expression